MTLSSCCNALVNLQCYNRLRTNACSKCRREWNDADAWLGESGRRAVWKQRRYGETDSEYEERMQMENVKEI